MDRVLFCYVNSTRFDRTEHYVQCEWSAVLSHLQQSFTVADLEYGLLGGPDRALVRALQDAPDVVIFWCAVHEAPATLRAAQFVRDVLPSAKILVWGDGPLWMPQYFDREPFDVWVTSGDPERVIADALSEMSHGRHPTHGVHHRLGGVLVQTRPGEFEDPDRWPLPPLGLIDGGSYDLVRQHRGKPGRDHSITVARGCGIRCEGCVDPVKSGLVDRRIPVPRLVDFLEQNADAGVTFQLHGPTFGADRAWCDAFAREMHVRRVVAPFKFVTLLKHVADASFVAPLVEAGAVGCGVGVETLTRGPRRLRLLQKHTGEAVVDAASRTAREHGFKLTAYLQVGLPGQSRDDIRYTIEHLRDRDFTLRPTGHTPFQRLGRLSSTELDALDLYSWDRKSFWEPGCGLTRGELLSVVASPERFVIPRDGVTSQRAVQLIEGAI